MPRLKRNQQAQVGNDPTRSDLAGTGPMTRQLEASKEGWEVCLRNQIKSHPRIALGIGLMAGLVAGWWIKR